MIVAIVGPIPRKTARFVEQGFVSECVMPPL